VGAPHLVPELVPGGWSVTPMPKGSSLISSESKQSVTGLPLTRRRALSATDFMQMNSRLPDEFSRRFV
jgi:hypothetical protein